MRFDLTDLQLFLHVVDVGSITAGAERSHLALASASARIRGMEEELGTPLLDRTRRGVQPTAAGLTLLHHAKAVLHRVADMHGALSDHACGLKVQVHLLCNTAALTQFLPGALGPFLVQHPQVEVELHELPSTEIVRRIAAGKADVGVVADSAGFNRLEMKPFRVDQLVAIFACRHLLANRSEVCFEELLDFPFLGLMKGSPLQDHIDSRAERLGRQVSYRLRVHDFESVCGLVRDEVGIAVVPETSMQRFHDSWKIASARVTDIWACRHLAVCMRGYAELPLHTRRLIDTMCLSQDTN